MVFPADTLHLIAMDSSKHPRCSYAAHLLGRIVMKACGWRVIGQIPPSSKLIVIAAPHTSNWDFIFLLGAAYHLRLSVNWLGKNVLFRYGAGPLMRFLGGVPVDRARSNNMVTQLVEDIGKRDGIALVIPPAGTRARTDNWKSGFYWIAYGAKIPLVCGYLDYARKEACLGLSFVPTGDVTADMDRIREFYHGISGKHPENTSTIRLREEH